MRSHLVRDFRFVTRFVTGFVTRFATRFVTRFVTGTWPAVCAGRFKVTVSHGGTPAG